MGWVLAVWRRRRVGLSAVVALAVLVSGGCGLPWGTDEVEDCERRCAEFDWECGKSGNCYCGACEVGYACHMSQCVSCEKLCADSECGDVEGCHCGDCPEGAGCNDWGECVDCVEVCDGRCGEVGTCSCGGCPEGHECGSEHTCECVPECDGPDGMPVECCDDGCGGSCGGCENGECVELHCFCEPDCDGKECGPDGCGGDCGACAPDKPICSVNRCYEPCSEMDVDLPIPVQRVHMMRPGKGGYAGEALDVDADPDTCGPPGDCEDGLDNQLSGLMRQMEQFFDAEEEIKYVLGKGVSILFEFGEPDLETGTFTLRAWEARPALPVAQCNHLVDSCEYLALHSSLELPGCTAAYVLDNAAIDQNGVLRAGGPGSFLPIPNQTAFREWVALMPACNGRIEALVQVEEGKGLVLTDGILAGALDKKALILAIDAIPEDAEIPVSRDMVKNLLGMFVQPDIDCDGDGMAESASVGYTFSTIPGTLVGLVPYGETEPD